MELYAERLTFSKKICLYEEYAKSEFRTESKVKDLVVVLF